MKTCLKKKSRNKSKIPFGVLKSQSTQEMWVQSLFQKDALDEEMATHSSILAWSIPWREESGGL